MSFLIHLAGTLCALAAATLAPIAARRWYLAVGTGGSFVVTLAWTGPDGVVNPVWLGSVAALAAALQLIRPGFFPLAAIAAGVLAAAWVPLLGAVGVATLPALILATGIPLISMLLASRREAFAPLPIQEEALLLVAALGVMLAAGPSVLEGWSSASVMNLDFESNTARDVPAALLLVGCATLLLGGSYTLWWRRR